MASIIDRFLRSRKIKFDSANLENEIMKKLGTAKLTKETLSNLIQFRYDAKNEELTQHDIDLLGENCSFRDLSISNVNLENKSLAGIKVENFRVDDAKLKGTILGGLGSNELMIRECSDFEISQLENMQAQKLVISYIGYKHDYKPYKTMEDLNKLKGIESFKKLSLIGIKNVQDVEISENVNSLDVSNCDINDLGVLKKFDSVKYLDARSNPYTDVSPILDMKNLRSFDASSSNVSVDNLDVVKQIKSINPEFYFMCNQTPLRDEMDRLAKEDVNQERNKEKVEIANPELLKHLLVELGKKEYTQITETDLKEFASRNRKEFEISSKLASEFLNSGLPQKMNISKLTIGIDKEAPLDIESLLTQKKKENSYGQLTLKLDSPKLDFPKKDLDLLNSRYGITYDIYGENYHIDEVMKMEKEIKKLIPELPENADEFEKIRLIYGKIKENIEVVDRKLIQADFSKTKFLTSTGEVVSGGTMSYFETEKPSLRNVDTILKDKKANELGMTLLLNATLASADFDVKLQDDTKMTGLLESNSYLVENTKKNEVKVNNELYNIKMGSDGLEFIAVEKKKDEVTGKEKSTISVEDVKEFTKDVPKNEVKEMLGELINEIDSKNVGDKHEEI